MGDTSTYSYDQLHFNASFKNALDWLPDSYVTTATTDVTMDLYAMDRTQVSGRKYAIKLTAGITLDGVSKLDYWVEFRSRYSGVDTIANGVLIYTANTTHDANASKLLDMAPTTSTFIDAGLPVGSSFTTADSRWKIVVNSQSGSGNDSLINVTISDARPPTITTQPVNAAVVAGNTATFTVAATGAGSLTYQWRKDGSVLVGATSATLSIANCQAANAGSYTVGVTNPNGTTTSTAAVLAILPPPTITIQPVSTTYWDGDTVNFTVVATGTAPLSYQWRKDGVALSGMTSATLTISNCQIGNEGSYTVVVTNPNGSVTSAAAKLTSYGCGSTTPFWQIFLFGGSAWLLCRFLQNSSTPASLPNLGELKPREGTAA